MTLKKYSDTIEYLYKQLPMHQRIGPKAIKKDLKNIKSLLKALDNPHLKGHFIHVGGTNGKGSVSHYIASILQEQGYTVGMYTSPHYKDYRERIKINGALMPKRKVVSFVNILIEKGIIDTIKPSFFELSVAMAFWYFNQQKPDFIIMEVGLGGRLDSTNVIKPLLSVITNISLDHQATLGNTHRQIASEKAGIIKKGIPALIGEYQEDVAKVFSKKATKENSDLFYAKDLGNVKVSRNEDPFTKRNKCTAMAAIELLNRKNHVKITTATIQSGLRNVAKNTYFIGRFQALDKDPLIVADSAHNEGGISLLFDYIEKVKFNKLHIILAMVGDKPLDKVLALFPKSAKYYFSSADIPRAMPKQRLQNVSASYDLSGKTYMTVRKALSAAKQSAQKNDLILVTGSVYTVAEVI